MGKSQIICSTSVINITCFPNPEVIFFPKKTEKNLKKIKKTGLVIITMTFTL